MTSFLSGCAAEELGVRVPSPKRIPDKYMTSSSDQSSSYQAFRGRIGLESRGPWGNSWCASESDSDPYIQIFFRMSSNLATEQPFLIKCFTAIYFQQIIHSGLFIKAIYSESFI